MQHITHNTHKTVKVTYAITVNTLKTNILRVSANIFSSKSSMHYACFFSKIDGCQDDQGVDGQEVWACMAGCRWRRVWLWNNTRDQEHSVHVLRWQCCYHCLEVCLDSSWLTDAVVSAYITESNSDVISHNSVRLPVHNIVVMKKSLVGNV